jgi:hypothetical protein
MEIELFGPLAQRQCVRPISGKIVVRIHRGLQNQSLSSIGRAAILHVAGTRIKTERDYKDLGQRLHTTVYGYALGCQSLARSPFWRDERNGIAPASNIGLP